MDKKKMAALLLRAGAVKLSPNRPFRYTSGLYAPIYTDNRVLLGDPSARARVLNALVKRLPKAKNTAVAGVATAGIPWAALAAGKLKQPLCYVRAKAKSHGRKNQVEGAPVRRKKVAVVEDLVSTGGSTLGAVKALRARRAKVKTALALFTYHLPASKKAFSKARVKLKTLTDLETLLRVAEKQGTLSSAGVKEVRQWQKDPKQWGKKKHMRRKNPKRGRKRKKRRHA